MLPRYKTREVNFDAARNELSLLDIDEVIELHAAQLAMFGGADGLRGRGLLESAIAQASFGGTYVHDGFFAMASA